MCYIRSLQNLKKRIVYFIVIFICGFPTILLSEHSSSQLNRQAIYEFIQRTVDSYKIPGLAVGIIKDNEVFFTSGYGESKPGVSITQDTPFILGSTTKMFTALAIMRLVEMGKLDLDTPIKKYLPDFRLAISKYEDKITIRHLLHHTSGLSGKGMPTTSFGKSNLRKELESLRHCVPTSPPGEQYLYFNTNYRLLGLIIEEVSGLKYGEFLNVALFKPLSMESTFAGPVGIQGLALGHGQIFGFPFQRKQIFRAGALPSGYLVSSVSDITKFLNAELQAGNGKPGVLNQDIVKTTWLPPENKKTGYAMGWLAMSEPGGQDFLVHGGALENYQSFFYINPKRRTGFVILMNQGGLLPVIQGFNTVRSGLLKILDNEQPENGPGVILVAAVSGVFLLGLCVEIFLTIRLKKWLSRIAKKPVWRQWIGIIFEFTISCFLLWGFIPMMNLLMGDKADWSMLYYLIPELFYFLSMLIIFGFLRSLLKTWIFFNKHRLLDRYNTP